jgi:hypothetical protein
MGELRREYLREFAAVAEVNGVKFQLRPSVEKSRETGYPLRDRDLTLEWTKVVWSCVVRYAIRGWSSCFSFLFLTLPLTLYRINNFFICLTLKVLNYRKLFNRERAHCSVLNFSPCLLIDPDLQKHVWKAASSCLPLFKQVTGMCKSEKCID